MLTQHVLHHLSRLPRYSSLFWVKKIKNWIDESLNIIFTQTAFIPVFSHHGLLVSILCVLSLELPFVDSAWGCIIALIKALLLASHFPLARSQSSWHHCETLSPDSHPLCQTLLSPTFPSGHSRVLTYAWAYSTLMSFPSSSFGFIVSLLFQGQINVTTSLKMLEFFFQDWFHFSDCEIQVPTALTLSLYVFSGLSPP